MSESEIPRREFLKKATIPIAVLAGISGGMLGGGIGANPSGGVGVDEKVKISSTDTTKDFLNPKISVGANIAKTILNSGSNEQLELTALIRALFPELGHVGVNFGTIDFIGIMGSFGQTGTISYLTDADGMFQRTTTASTSDSEARSQSTFTIVQRRHNFRCLIKFRLNNTANVRMWIGVFSAPSSSVPLDDPFTTHLAGLRYSTSAGDTNFKFATKDGTTINLVNAIAVDTNVHYLLIESLESIPNITMTLFNNNIVQQATNVFTTNLPANATNLFLFLKGIVTLATGSKSMDLYGASIRRFTNLSL